MLFRRLLKYKVNWTRTLLLFSSFARCHCADVVDISARRNFFWPSFIKPDQSFGFGDDIDDDASHWCKFGRQATHTHTRARAVYASAKLAS